MARVKTALEAVPGVQRAEVNLETGEASVSYDPQQCSVEDLTAAVTDAGFGAQARH